MWVIQIGITFACTFQKNIEIDLGQGAGVKKTKSFANPCLKGIFWLSKLIHNGV